ncbi:aspartate 1-decarboxylase, partial [bacterium B13(2017)]
IIPYEKILIINVNTASRFETYAIEEAPDTNKFCLYGGAARLGVSGDPIIILSFAKVTPEEAKEYKPKILNF